MDKQNDLFQNEFDAMYADSYREGKSSATNPEHQLPSDTEATCTGGQPSTLETPSGSTTDAAKELAAQCKPRDHDSDEVYGISAQDIINAMLPGGRPGNSRHDFGRKLVYDLICLTRGDSDFAKSMLLKQVWGQEIVDERSMSEIDRMVEWALRQYRKREAENFNPPQPSKLMREAIRQIAGRPYNVLVREDIANATGQVIAAVDDILQTLERIGQKLEKFFPHYEFLRLLCYHLKRKHFIAALYIGGGFGDALLTRMWYRFWSEPGRKCFISNIVELIGRSGSGKHIAVDLYRILMEPVKKSDAVFINAVNNWNEEYFSKNGSSKTQKPRPKAPYRCMPSETSAAAIREAMYNAWDEIDGEKWPLSVILFNSELFELLSQQKKAYMNIEPLLYKALHNEPAGAFLKTASSPVGDLDVHLSAVLTGTSQAIALQTTTEKFAKGEPMRLAAVPMGDSNFEMREKRTYTEEDQQRDEQLRDWAYRLDSTKGEIPFGPISDALHSWTARRMADAKEEGSFALEDLVKRPCWIAANLAIPFIISRHWDQMVEDSDGRWKCGPDFKTDKKDVDLTIAICDAQFAFQQYFFLAIGEKLYDDQQAALSSNTHHQQKTWIGYRRLPNPFTSQDVDVAFNYEGKTGSICSKIKRLVDDGLAQKINKGPDKG